MMLDEGLDLSSQVVGYAGCPPTVVGPWSLALLPATTFGAAQAIYAINMCSTGEPGNSAYLHSFPGLFPSLWISGFLD